MRALAVFGMVLAAATAFAVGAHAGARATRFVASYDVVLSGGMTRAKHSDNQASDPKNRVIIESDDSYDGRGTLSLKEEANGRLVPSSSSFAYSSATWSLNGQNGSDGGFSCSPPITTTDGTVDAAGWVEGGVLYVRFLLDGTQERNADYDCGAHFTGYSTSSNYEADSLLQVEDDAAGPWITTSADHPAVGTLVYREDTGTSPNTKHTVSQWSVSIAKRSGSKHDDGPTGPSTSPRPTRATRRICTINGTPGNDVLVGTSHDDVICGYGGKDTILGGAGSDLVYGGPGNDRINAKDGTIDHVDGGPGRDTGTFDRAPRDRVVRVEHRVFG